MVKTLHKAGLEVILDVVYNHTAEGNERGPMLSFRGIDNVAYYRLREDNPRYYVDITGCGNTVDMRNPRAFQMMMDSLRYWVADMHVDGFRFDLAPALGRELHQSDHIGPFFELLRQDFSNRVIAQRLSVSERTIKFHVSNVLRKLHVASRKDLQSLESTSISALGVMPQKYSGLCVQAQTGHCLSW